MSEPKGEWGGGWRPGGEQKTLRWSVGIEAEGGRVLTREEVVELADAVAACEGIATGIGTSRYGAQLVVQAADRDEAIERATMQFEQAAARAGLPAAPIVRVEAVSEPEGRGGAWTEERGSLRLSDEGRRRLKGAPEASKKHSEDEDEG